MNKNYIGNGKVVLIAGGGKVYTDVAARFCKSEKSLEEIIATPYDRELVKKILECGHLAALEFNHFIFGYEGYSRVCETQLVRKRHASYLIKSGRVDKNGKRSFDVVIPKNIEDFHVNYRGLLFDSDMILELINAWYNEGVRLDKPEEDLRYIKVQGTESKGIICLNNHALIDFFSRRCCKNSQFEIRDMANKMLKICREAQPDIFEDIGAPCIKLKYCPENTMQNKRCIGKIPTHNDITKAYYGG